MAEMTGQPLQYMESGVLSGCGLRVVAVRPLDANRMEASEISVNVYVSGKAVIKAIAYAPMSTKPGAASVREVKVASSWAKAPNAKPTVQTGDSFAGDSKLSLLHTTDPRGVFAVLLAVQDDRQIQVAIRREGQKGENILAGQVKLEAGESQQLNQCVSELLEAMKTRVERK
jgi:hypothetical protein